MQITFTRAQRRWIAWLLCSLIILYGLYGAYSALTNSLQDSQDVHIQWFPGQKILLGLNPYTVENSDDPRLVSNEGMGHLPTNTAVMNLVFLPLSLFDWDTAAWIVRILNYILAALVVVLALRMLPQKLSWWVQLTAVMAFVGTHPVRETILLGQPSLLLLLLMLISIRLAPHNQWLAGLAFGIALSKYSVSLPIALWFWSLGYWRVLLVAGLVQIGGFALLALLTQQGLVDVIWQYINIARGLVSERGTLDFASAAQRANIPVSFGLALSVAATLLVLFAVGHRLGWRALSGLRPNSHAHASERILVFALLCTYALIVVYHRTYDAVLLLMLPIAVASMTITQDGALDLARLLTRRIAVLVWLVYIMFSLPARTIETLWPAWENLYPLVLNLMMLVAFGTLVWYCWTFRLPEPHRLYDGRQGRSSLVFGEREPLQ